MHIYWKATRFYGKALMVIGMLLVMASFGLGTMFILNGAGIFFALVGFFLTYLLGIVLFMMGHKQIRYIPL